MKHNNSGTWTRWRLWLDYLANVFAFGQDTISKPGEDWKRQKAFRKKVMGRPLGLRSDTRFVQPHLLSRLRKGPRSIAEGIMNIRADQARRRPDCRKELKVTLGAEMDDEMLQCPVKCAAIAVLWASHHLDNSGLALATTHGWSNRSSSFGASFFPVAPGSHLSLTRQWLQSGTLILCTRIVEWYISGTGGWSDHTSWKSSTVAWQNFRVSCFWPHCGHGSNASGDCGCTWRSTSGWSAVLNCKWLEWSATTLGPGTLDGNSCGHTSRGASRLHDLMYPTYVLVTPEVFQDMDQRPQGLLEIVSFDHHAIRATVLPYRINLPITQLFLKSLWLAGQHLERWSGTTHNSIVLTEARQDCHSGFYVLIMVDGVEPLMAEDLLRGLRDRVAWCILATN